jgi:hypothetical protein
MEEARKEYAEALQIGRELAQKNTETYRPYVAETLNDLGGLDSAQDRMEVSRPLFCSCSSISACAVRLLTAVSTTSQTPPIGPRANSKLPVIKLIGPAKTSSFSSLSLQILD